MRPVAPGSTLTVRHTGDGWRPATRTTRRGMSVAAKGSTTARSATTETADTTEVESTERSGARATSSTKSGGKGSGGGRKTGRGGATPAGDGGRRLVIVESPAKARKIADYLGSRYIVESSRGHIRDLPRGAADVPAKYKGESWARLGVDVDHQFQPLYIVTPEKRGKV